MEVGVELVDPGGGLRGGEDGDRAAGAVEAKIAGDDELGAGDPMDDEEGAGDRNGHDLGQADVDLLRLDLVLALDDLFELVLLDERDDLVGGALREEAGEGPGVQALGVRGVGLRDAEAVVDLAPEPELLEVRAQVHRDVALLRAGGGVPSVHLVEVRVQEVVHRSGDDLGDLVLRRGEGGDISSDPPETHGHRG